MKTCMQSLRNLKYSIIFVIAYALFITACSTENPPATYIIAPTFNVINVEASPDFELVRCNIPVYSILVGAPLLPPPPPRNAAPSTLTLLIDGTFTTLNAKNIDGSNYFRLADLQYVLKDTDICEDTMAQILCIAWESGYAISEYHYNGSVYVNLRQIADFLGLRVAWVASRRTIIIDINNSYALYPIFTAEPLPEHIIQQITGSSFHPEAPFDYCHLSYLTITYADFYGISRYGHLIVAASIADEVLDIFREIYEYRFPIARMRLIDYYSADDYYSMADNNSVAFNFRVIAGTNTLSRHAWGMAIDINPIQNPFIRGDVILPIAGSRYIDRTNIRPGMIIPGDVVYRAFTSHGWIWGGNWRIPIDYHHFERR